LEGERFGGTNKSCKKTFRGEKFRLLVVVALGFSVAIMLSIPVGIMANQESMYPYCGREIQLDDTFCPHCSGKLTDKEGE
jgi:hypothetical protein